jgi:tRNA (Thr-GGU) A37 N-methylase
MIDVDHLDPYLLQPVGIVRSKLKRLEDCPLQGSEGGPDAWVEIHPAFADGLDGITPGCEVVLLTWFHKARRNVLKLHPRDNPLFAEFLQRVRLTAQTL